VGMGPSFLRKLPARRPEAQSLCVVSAHVRRRSGVRLLLLLPTLLFFFFCACMYGLLLVCLFLFHTCSRPQDPPALPTSGACGRPPRARREVWPVLLQPPRLPAAQGCCSLPTGGPASASASASWRHDRDQPAASDRLPQGRGVVRLPTC
jgi:hypothetical protein